MKIHIIGGSGTGKSYISKIISKKYNVPHYDLDNIFWDNNADSYGTKMPEEIRANMLNEILKSSDWIIEGVFYSWLNESFLAAEKIFIIKSSSIIFNYRILKRFIKRKLKIEESKRETIKSLIDLLIWTNNYQKNNIPKILEFLNPYAGKIIIVKKSKDILRYVDCML